MEKPMIRKPKMSRKAQKQREQHRRRKQREDRRRKGGNVRNWPTRGRKDQVRKINVNDLSPAERERYGFEVAA
jgi:hypothetical protein